MSSSLDCTSFQYIGELCRYLVAAPPNPAEKDHSLASHRQWTRAGCLARHAEAIRADFRVLEFYASTEGNVWLYNVEGRIGSIGRLPPYLADRDTIALVRYDPDAQSPLRGADGFCVRCLDDELARRSDASGRAAAALRGLQRERETEKKILRNVFAGDAWMRTGDLMRRGANGFYYFVIASATVSLERRECSDFGSGPAVLAACPGVAEAIVYGVALPGADGRAGMAAVKIDGWLDLGGFRPRFGRPAAIRPAAFPAPCQPRSNPQRPSSRGATSMLRRASIRNALRIRSMSWTATRRIYVPLDAERYAAIVEGKMRL